MTKKFWNDWKGRIGETEQIYTAYKWLDHYENERRYSHCVLNKSSGDRIIKTSFNGDKVDLVVERHSRVFNKSAWQFHDHVENEYLSLNRADIVSVEFKKYGEKEKEGT